MSNWVPRTSPPSSNNPWYVKTTYGGYNQCILINAATGECIPNCVGYAWGRFCEGVNITYCNLSRGNASSWYGTGDGYARGQDPQVGSVMCWGGGYYGGAGHVAIVERVIDNNTVVTSESNYGGARWESRTRYRGDGRWGMTANFWFQGFIYNPYVDPGVVPPPYDPDDPQPEPEPTYPPPPITVLLMPILVYHLRKKQSNRLIKLIGRRE